MADINIVFDSLEVSSYVRGHHVYKDIWTPSEGEVLQLQRDSSNPKDRFAVAVCRIGEVVGRVPFNLAPTFSRLLQRECNTGSATITGPRVNRGGGFGLEVPCVYTLHGPKVYLDRAKDILPKSNYTN